MRLVHVHVAFVELRVLSKFLQRKKGEPFSIRKGQIVIFLCTHLQRSTSKSFMGQCDISAGRIDTIRNIFRCNGQSVSAPGSIITISAVTTSNSMQIVDSSPTVILDLLDLQSPSPFTVSNSNVRVSHFKHFLMVPCHWWFYLVFWVRN
jgi:hypothetical protein